MICKLCGRQARIKGCRGMGNGPQWILKNSGSVVCFLLPICGFDILLLFGLAQNYVIPGLKADHE